jgi:hypothetical protein
MENLNKLNNYRIIIKEILKQYASYQPSYGDIEIQTVFDSENDHYQVIAVGWDGKQRIYGCSLHLDLKEGKIWIQVNNTKLVNRGISKQDIVIGFHTTYLRQFSGYALA